MTEKASIKNAAIVTTFVPALLNPPNEALVDTRWVQDHISDPSVRIVEVDYDPTANYELGHITNAVLWNWRRDLNHPIQRDILGKDQLQRLLERSGIGPETRIVLYGDYSNWFAAFAFWILAYYRVKNVAMVDGGRKKWFIEDRDLTKATPEYQPATRQVLDPIEEIRAYLPQVREAVEKRNQILVDVRSPREFTGEVTAPPEYPDEHAQRGGHIPGAVNIPWWQATNEDGSFKSTEVLRNLYGSFGVKSNRDVITYCRIGERSSHTWFVLKHLLGYANVRNYDGSWAEWGNMVRNQIQKP